MIIFISVLTDKDVHAESHLGRTLRLRTRPPVPRYIPFANMEIPYKLTYNHALGIRTLLVSNV